MQLRRAESLQGRNSLALPASAAALALVDTDQDLMQALDWSRAEGLQALPLGQGSNVVFAGDLEALVVCQNNNALKILSEQGDKVSLRVAAGCDWHSLVHQTLQLGMYGLENLAYIPGTVGAAPIQNIGAYGVEFERFVQAVKAVDIHTGKPITLSRKECDFGYRDSVFKRELRDKVIITAVDLCLSRDPLPELSYPALSTELAMDGVTEPTPEDVFSAVVRVRRSRLPSPEVEPNVGSFFKNPVIDKAQANKLVAEFGDMPTFAVAGEQIKIPAAWLIDQLGWKGHRQDGVGVHAGHALVLVNYGAGTGKALLQLAEDIASSVNRRFHIALEVEPRVYGMSS